MNALSCLKVLNFYESLTVEAMMAGLAAGGSPLLESLMVPVMEHEELPCVLAALESRSCHETCMPLRQFSMHQYREEKEVLNRLFACRMLASVEHLTLGGHARGWMDALVVYLEEGLKQGRPRGVKRLYAASYCDDPFGDAELLMDFWLEGGHQHWRSWGDRGGGRGKGYTGLRRPSGFSVTRLWAGHVPS
jgi:hypothetical protein